MKVAIIIGLMLVAAAYLGVTGYTARAVGVSPQARFTADIASFYLGMAIAMTAAIRGLIMWLVKHLHSHRSTR
jgi:hypothetical protein